MRGETVHVGVCEGSVADFCFVHVVTVFRLEETERVTAGGCRAFCFFHLIRTSASSHMLYDVHLYVKVEEQTFLQKNDFFSARLSTWLALALAHVPETLSIFLVLVFVLFFTFASISDSH